MTYSKESTLTWVDKVTDCNNSLAVVKTFHKEGCTTQKSTIFPLQNTKSKNSQNIQNQARIQAKKRKWKKLISNFSKFFAKLISNCVICMENFKEGDTLRTMICLHRFHRNCIDKWIKSNAICPICRKQLVD